LCHQAGLIGHCVLEVSLGYPGGIDADFMKHSTTMDKLDQCAHCWLSRLSAFLFFVAYRTIEQGCNLRRRGKIQLARMALQVSPNS
jgi:hypothetical protein